tara:strand:+ start:517 stop:855 length:339 start_codon:yes stop_codon:yes gene_type:complete
MQEGVLLLKRESWKGNHYQNPKAGRGIHTKTLKMEAAILPKHQSRKRHCYQNHKTGGGVTIKTSKQEGHHYQTVITTSDIATKTLKLEGASLPNYTADWGITIKTPLPNCHS